VTLNASQKTMTINSAAKMQINSHWEKTLAQLPQPKTHDCWQCRRNANQQSPGTKPKFRDFNIPSLAHKTDAEQMPSCH